MANINICYAPNYNYAGLAAVSMASVLKNAKESDLVNFIILYDKTKFNSATINKILEIKSIKDCNIRLIHVNSEIFDGYPLTNWVTVDTWFRTKVTEICPEYDKILYLDCDTLVLDSLSELFNIDLGDNYVGVVCNCNKYFNAGVILFNTGYCNKNNLFDKVKTYIRTCKNKIKYADQDVLNIVTDGKKFELPQEYNYCENYFRELSPNIIKQPKIIHFVGPNPNRFDCRNSNRYLWERYAKMTPFYNDFVEKNIYNLIKMYPKIKFDKLKYRLLSKILLGKSREHYKLKSIVLSNVIKELEY